MWWVPAALVVAGFGLLLGLGVLAGKYLKWRDGRSGDRTYHGRGES